MICVSIGRGRHRHMMAEHRHLVDQGACLVELRLDYINGKVNVRRLLQERPCPVIVTVRRQEDGGKWEGAEEDRQLLLRTAIAEGADYVDLEEDVATTISRFGETKRVVSLHNFRTTPPDLEGIHARLAALDPDIVKIATLANQPHDNVRILQLVQRTSIPTVGLCMGDIGTPSRILGTRVGAPFTFATFHHERALAPGQLSFQQMREIYRYDEIDQSTEVFGVIADPVGHSLSPIVHNAAFAELCMNRVYVPFRVPRNDLATFMDDAPSMGIKGLSVTIPHKESIVKHLTRVDGAVRGVGAANTVIFENGEIVGYNTDYRAAMSSMEEATDSGRKAIVGKSALILGAGGVARAIAFGLRRRQADVTVASRTRERADRLAERIGCRAIDWGSRHNVSPDILVNCTPVGLHPNVDETPFEKHYLRPSMVVFDTVYNPEQTLLIKDARDRTCTVITGVDMFVRQASLQFEHFTGQQAPADLMRDRMRRAIGPARY